MINKIKQLFCLHYYKEDNLTIEDYIKKCQKPFHVFWKCERCNKIIQLLRYDVPLNFIDY